MLQTSKMNQHIAVKIVVAVLALLLIAFAVNVVLLVFASILLAVALRAVAEPLAKRIGISEPWAAAIVVALLAVLFSGVGGRSLRQSANRPLNCVQHCQMHCKGCSRS